MTDALSRLTAALSDRYAIERELGRGGMATVYLAEDLKLHRKVALKVLRPELASALGPDRFLQEIDIAAKLNHPHILGLFDCGEAYGFLYYVMPYVEGQSLRDKLAKEVELPITEAVRILRDVVEALSHAHKHNVVHRDIKPDNVMLSEDHALVTDFGVAKAVSDATGAIGLTTEGVALGTPAYMAPEQAAADPHIDHRADIYAVGVIAYELLTGRTPFVGNTQQELLAAHVTQTPEPVTKYRESVSPVLAELVMKCLEKKAADRWQTAEELLPQLEALATPSAGVTPTGMASVGQMTKRRWFIAGGAVAAIIAVVAVVIGLRRGSEVALDPNHVAVAVFRNATGDPTLDHIGERAGQWITQGLHMAAIPTTPWDQVLHSSEYIQTETDAGRIRDPLRALAEETGAGTVVSGAIYLLGDSIEVQMSVTDAARGRSIGALEPVRATRHATTELIDSARERVMGFFSVRFDSLIPPSARLTGQPPTFEAYKAWNEGDRLYNQQRYREAIPYFRRAAELDSVWAPPLRGLLYAIDNAARSDGGIAHLDSIYELLTKRLYTYPPYDRALGEVLVAVSEGDHERRYQAARRAAQMAPGSRAVFIYAQSANRANRPREAVDALLILDPERGPMRGYVRYWYVLIEALHMLGEHKRELEMARRGSEHHPDGGPAILSLQANALAAMGRVEELNQVLDDMKAAPNIENEVLSLSAAVYVLRANGFTDEARLFAEELIEWFESRLPDVASMRVIRYGYSEAMFLAGRYAEAQSTADSLVLESASVRSSPHRSPGT